MLARAWRPGRWHAYAWGLGIGVALLSPALQLATGSPLPYILVLTLFIALAWWLTPLDRRSIGFTPGHWRHHVLAIAYPIIVLGSLAALALLTDQASIGDTSPARAMKNILLMTAVTFVGVIISEEGFYRGVLWGIGSRAGWSPMRLLMFTSIMFMLWHVAVPIIDPAFELPAHVIPVYLVNATLLGLARGLIFNSAGRLVASTAHAVWNGLVYTLFGYGEKSGVIALENHLLLDAERGIAGLVVNTACAVILVTWAIRARPASV